MCRIILLGLLCLSGCGELNKISMRTRFGPDFRKNAAGENTNYDTKWTVSHGYKFDWENGWSTDFTYYRSDIDNGTGGFENAVFIGVTIPIWEKQ